MEVRGQLVDSDLDFHFVGLGSGTQVVQSGKKHFYPLDHFPDLKCLLNYCGLTGTSLPRMCSINIRGIIRSQGKEKNSRVPPPHLPPPPTGLGEQF